MGVDTARSESLKIERRYPERLILSNTRGEWSSSFGFIMAAAGSAVGLGNLWKFPYLTGQHGGAAFVLLYLIFMVIIGVTILLAEITLGRGMRRNGIEAFARVGKRLAWIGAMGLVAAVLILSFYGVIGGWILRYFCQTFVGGVGEAPKEFFATFIGHPWVPVLFQVLFMLATAFIVIRGIAGGIERGNKIMMPGLFILLVILGVRSVTLSGAGTGIEFFLNPDVSKITPASIVAALGQVFFSLSLGIGCMLTYGSYLNRNSNLGRCAMTIPSLDTVVALLAGFAILPAVFAFGFEPSEGPGLMFVSLPAVFSQMPLGIIFFGLFFLLAFFAALTSSISLLEIPVSWLVDAHGWHRRKAVVTCTVITTLLGIPSCLSFGPVMGDVTFFGKTFFELVDFIASNIIMPVGGFCMCIVVGYIWGIDKAVEEITSGGNFSFKLHKVWSIMLRYVAPAALIIIFLDTLGVLGFLK